MKKILNLLALIASVYFIQSCSSDFDVIGEYEETTIVYGLMDQSEDVHYIKINKSFLGPGDANAYALVRDSSEYANVNAKVEEWINGVKVREWALRDTTITNREDGLFYNPEQTVYYFVEPNLDAQAEYRLAIDINEGEKFVDASTTLINSFSFNYAPNTNPTSTIGFAQINSTTQVITYNAYPIKWVTGKKGKRYDLSIRFWFDECTISDTTRKYVDWFVGSHLVSDNQVLTGGAQIDAVAEGESFYNQIANRVQSDPAVLRRIVKGVDIMVAAASDDLYTYMIVNAPSNGIIQERPQFTNVNNGVGIFTSRYNQSILNKKLSKSAIDVLCNGNVTGHLNFCSDTLIYSAETFYCQ